MSDGFMVWSFWVMMLLALAYAIYSVVRPDAAVSDSRKEGGGE